MFTYFYVDSDATNKSYANRIAGLCHGIPKGGSVHFENESDSTNEANLEKAKRLISSERLYGFSANGSKVDRRYLTVNDLTMLLNGHGAWMEAMMTNCCLVIRVGQFTDRCKHLESMSDAILKIMKKVKKENSKKIQETTCNQSNQ